MKHPRTVTTFSDSGAHVTQLMDSSLQTHLLYHWVRTKQAFTLEQAVRMLTSVPRRCGASTTAGLIREGMAATSSSSIRTRSWPRCRKWWTTFPPVRAPLVQRTRGVAATVVNGQVLLRNGKHTGALPGQLLRGPLGRRG
jgi:N-acyl-D-aspartate/D-glutamate deacylase